MNKRGLYYTLVCQQEKQQKQEVTEEKTEFKEETESNDLKEPQLQQRINIAKG